MICQLIFSATITTTTKTTTIITTTTTTTTASTTTYYGKFRFLQQSLKILAFCFVMFLEIHIFFIIAKQFLIIGGETNSDGNNLATEVIDVQSNSNVASLFGEIPSQRRYAVGGLIDSTPIICGGDDKDEKDQDSCFTYSQSKWTKTHTMTTKRYAPASVKLNDTTLWIMGGYNSGAYLDSSEFIGLDSTVGNPGPKLPNPLEWSCAVKYSADKVYVIGGYDGSSILNKVLIFNPMDGFSHIEGPSLITKRSGHACALMSNGQQKQIVVAGGGSLSSVEILDPTVNKWVPGKRNTLYLK